MITRKISNSNVSAIGLGCMPISDVYGNAGRENDRLELLEYALDLGIDLWDTADVYGIDHSNEILLSKILKDRRNEVFLSTKFGFRLKKGEHDNFKAGSTYLDGSPQYVKKACDKSLERLKTDHIDLYYAHRVDPNVPVEETVAAMAELIEEGKVRYIGLSECTPEDLKKAEKVHHIDAVESEFSIYTRGALEEIIPLCKENGTAFIPFSPLSRGLASAKFDASSLEMTDFRGRLPRFSGNALNNNQAMAEEMVKKAKELECTASQLSLAWILSKGDNIIPIPGTKHKEYLKENAESVKIHLSGNDLRDIEEIISRHPNTGERYSSNEQRFVKK